MSLQNSTLTGTIYIASSEPVLEDVSVKSTTVEQTVTAGEGYDGIGEVTVNPISLQNKNVTPSGSQQQVTADNGYDGLGTVTVDAAPASEEVLDKIMYSNSSSDVFEYNVMEKSGSSTCFGFAQAKLNVKLPNNITVIQNSAFSNIAFLKSIECPNVASIKDHAFDSCQYLVSAKFSRTGIMDGKIYAGAFKNCSRLTDVYFASFFQIYSSNYDQFTGMGNLTVHVPASLLETYQNDSDWHDFIVYVATTYGLTVTIVGDYE